MSDYLVINHPTGHVEKIYSNSSYVEPVNRLISVKEFLDRFSEDALDNIMDSTNKKVKSLVLKIQVRNMINLDSPNLVKGLDTLQKAGFITVEEVAAIRA